MSNNYGKPIPPNFGFEPLKEVPHNFGFEPLDPKNKEDISNESWNEYLTHRIPGLALRAGAKGIAGLGDIPNWAALGLHHAGLKKGKAFYASPSEKVGEWFDYATDNKYKPRNKGEEYLEFIVESAAPIALAPLTGGASLTSLGLNAASKAAKAGKLANVLGKASRIGKHAYAPTLTNIGGTVGSAAGMKRYLDTSEDPGMLGMVLSGLAGSAPGAGVGSALRNPKNIYQNLRHPIESSKNLAARELAEQYKFNPKKLKEYRELGLTPTLSDVSDQATAVNRESNLAKSSAGRHAFGQHSQRLETELANNLGLKVEDWNDLSHIAHNPDYNIAKRGAEGYKNKTTEKFKKLREVAKPTIKKFKKEYSEVDVEKLINSLESRKEGIRTERGQKNFDKTPSGRLLKILKEQSQQNAAFSEQVPLSSKPSILEDIKTLKKAGVRDNQLESGLKQWGHSEKDIKNVLSSSPKGSTKIPYKELRDIRKAEFELSDNPGLSHVNKRAHSLNNRDLSQIETEHFQKHAPKEAAKAMEESNKVWYDYAYKNKNKTNPRDYVESIEKISNDPAAFRKVLTEDPMFAKIVHEGLEPEEQKALAKTAILHLGSDGEKKWTPTRFYTNLNKINPNTQEWLLKSFTPKELGKFRKTLKLIGEKKKRFQEIENTSRTAHTAHEIARTKELSDSLLEAIFTLGKRPIGRVLRNVVGQRTESQLAKMFTDPEWIARIEKAMTKKGGTAFSKELQAMFPNRNKRALARFGLSLKKRLMEAQRHKKDIKSKD